MPEEEMRKRRNALGKGIILVVIGAALVGGMAMLASSQDRPSLVALYAENVPGEGAETAYGLPLAWENAPLFATWYNEIVLTEEEARVLDAALAPLPAPCCDDNPLARCCCERGGLICNIVRTARGLGKYLVRHGWKADEVTAAMDEWLRFIHGDYYVARALVALGEDPVAYGLFKPENGACYRGLCTAPLQEGGCGGMGEDAIIARPRS